MITTRKINFDSLKVLHFIFFATVLLFLTSCGDGSAKLTTAEANAFAAAPADIKQLWEKALTADKANDYSAAQKALDGLAQVQLSAEQKVVLDKQRAVFSQRLWAAAEKNDSAAVKVVQESKGTREQMRGGTGR